MMSINICGKERLTEKSKYQSNPCGYASNINIWTDIYALNLLLNIFNTKNFIVNISQY